MTTVKGMLERVQNLDVGRLVKMTIGQTRQLIVEKNQDQLTQGIKSDGSNITPEYTFFTKEKKKAKGRDPDIVTLYDTGDFYRDMFVDVGSDVIEIDSTDYKSEDLKDKYGDKIFGMTRDSKEEYVNEAIPVLVDKIKEILKL